MVSLVKGKKYPSATALGLGATQLLLTSDALGVFPNQVANPMYVTHI